MGTLVIVFLISGAIFFYMYQRHQKLVDSGKVINRDRNFVEKAEDFVLTLDNPGEVTRGLQEISYAEMKVSMRIGDGGHSFQFTGNNMECQTVSKKR